MPRPWLEKVEDYSPYRSGAAYECIVTSVEKLSGPNRIQVELEHLDDAQLGRPLTVLFPRPIPPAGRPIEFFRACGLNIAIDSEFAPKDAIGKRVVCFFERDDDGEWHPIRFEPVTKESAHDTPA
jgi:hypothetical protein